MLGNDLEWKYLIWRPAQVSVYLCRVGSGADASKKNAKHQKEI